MRAASDSRCRADSAGPTIASPPVTGLINSEDRLVSRYERSTLIPPQYTGTVSSSSVSPSDRSASSGRKRSSPGLSRMPLPSVLTTVTAPRRNTSTSPTTPSRESARRSSGSAKSASTRRSTTSTRLRVPIDRIHSLPSRTTRSALSTNGKPARWPGRPGRTRSRNGCRAQHHHHRLLGRLRGGVDQGQPQRLRPRRGRPRRDPLVEVGERAGDHPPVSQRIARSRRRLRPVGVHPEAPSAAADIAAVQEQLMAARHLDAAGGPDVARDARTIAGRAAPRW